MKTHSTNAQKFSFTTEGGSERQLADPDSPQKICPVGVVVIVVVIIGTVVAVN